MFSGSGGTCWAFRYYHCYCILYNASITPSTCCDIRWCMVVSNILFEVTYECRVVKTSEWDYKLNIKGTTQSGYHEVHISRNPEVWPVHLESPSLYASYMTRWTQNMSQIRFCIWTFKTPPEHELKVATTIAHVLYHVFVNIWSCGNTH